MFWTFIFRHNFYVQSLLKLILICQKFLKAIGIIHMN